MKTYENEQTFVTSFAKDAKESIKSNGKFEAVVNNIPVVVTGMNNQNSSKVTVYSGTVNGVSFEGSITALKKKLNVTFKKEYNRSSEAAKSANTKVIIKSDDELTETAKKAAKKIGDAFEVMYQASQKYGLSRADMLERTGTVEALILEALKQQRDRVAKERADKEAQQAAEAAKREEKKQTLLNALSKAAASGDYEEITRLTKELKTYM